MFLLVLTLTTQAQEAGRTLIIQGNISEVHDVKSTADGTYDLRFDLYDSSSKVTLLGSETQEEVLVVNGIFNVVLGKQEPLDTALQRRPLFVEIHQLPGRVPLSHPTTLHDSATYVEAPTMLQASLAKTEQHHLVSQLPVAGLTSHTDSSADTLAGEHSETSEEHNGKLSITPGGYVEAFYSYNFNRPENNLSALRGFDFIHNSLTISNVVMSMDASYQNFTARVALNVGLAPSQFYKQEPKTVASYHIPTMDRYSWQFIQEALIGWHVKSIPGLTIQAGVMSTPIGLEGLPSYQSWEGSMKSPHMLLKITERTGTGREVTHSSMYRTTILV